MKPAVVKPKPYRLFEPTGTEKLGLWSKHIKQYDQIIGYSSLGHVFLRNEGTNEYAVFHPIKAASKSYDEHPSIEEFEEKVLKDASFSEYVLRAGQMASLSEELGPLENDEVYIPQPIPLLDGAEAAGAPKRYAKGDVWDFIEVIGQLHGLGA